MSHHDRTPQSAEGSLESRPYDRDPRHQADDLRASLRFARDEGLIDAVATRAVVEMFRLSAEQPGRPHAQNELRILAEENPLAFGLVCRFHLEARTSLIGDAESASRMALSRGLTVGDLGWPKSVLRFGVEDAADEDPGLESRLAEAIGAWRLAHADD